MIVEPTIMSSLRVPASSLASIVVSAFIIEPLRSPCGILSVLKEASEQHVIAALSINASA